MISIGRVECAECTSDIEAHRNGAPEAMFGIGIGDAGANLCEGCARKLFNMLGAMLASATGESLQQLIGLRGKKGKS